MKEAVSKVNEAAFLYFLVSGDVYSHPDCIQRFL
jgi:hypothetical protein